MEALKQELSYYTYADYANWDEARYELIDGMPYSMSPAPRRAHQRICGEIFSQLHSYLKGKPCEVYIAPFDVRLNGAGDKDDTVVQPDIVVVCDRTKLDDKGCNGAPDLIVEVLSPSTAKHDRILKFNKYLQAGVREYWIVDPDASGVTVHLLRDGEYVTKAYSDTDNAPVHVIPECNINLQEVFAE